MIALAYAILAAIAVTACGFVAGPILRARENSGRFVLLAAAALCVVGVGGGLYLYLGQPQLAVRTLEGSNAGDLNA